MYTEWSGAVKQYLHVLEETTKYLHTREPGTSYDISPRSALQFMPLLTCTMWPFGHNIRKDRIGIDCGPVMRTYRGSEPTLIIYERTGEPVVISS